MIVTQSSLKFLQLVDWGGSNTKNIWSDFDESASIGFTSNHKRSWNDLQQQYAHTILEHSYQQICLWNLCYYWISHLLPVCSFISRSKWSIHISSCHYAMKEGIHILLKIPQIYNYNFHICVFLSWVIDLGSQWDLTGHKLTISTEI